MKRGSVKYSLIMCCFVMFVILSHGCLSQIASLEEFVEGWKGRPLSELKEMLSRPESYPSRIGWKEKTYTLGSGNLVYIEPVRPDCYIHWEVNRQGIIVNYKTEGSRCY